MIGLAARHDQTLAEVFLIGQIRLWLLHGCLVAVQWLECPMLPNHHSHLWAWFLQSKHTTFGSSYKSQVLPSKHTQSRISHDFCFMKNAMPHDQRCVYKSSSVQLHLICDKKLVQKLTGA